MNKPLTSQPTAALSRRTVFAGAGTVGAMAAVASVLPSIEPSAKTAAGVADGVQPGGYQETPHVKRYYQTARV